MMDMDEPAVPDLFRPSKRRKFYRKRTETDDEETTPVSQSADPASPAPEPAVPVEVYEHVAPSPIHLNDEPALSVAEIIRQRKAAQRKRGGVEFTSSAIPGSASPQASNALVVQEEAEDDIPADIKSVIARFAPQTGQVSEETDKHM